MTKTSVWKTIAATLTDEIAVGIYPAGEKLPTEAQLATRFGVNRHTVRRALAEMGEKGLVYPRRGAGVFVATVPTEYPLGRRVRFHQNVLDTGRTPSRQILRIETLPASPLQTEVLGLPADAMVHLIEGLSLADGLPLARFISVFPAARFPDFPQYMAAQASVTHALAACGLSDYTRASTRLTAKLADSILSRHLRIPDGAAVLRSEAVNIDALGQAVEYGLSLIHI
jgi:GntR family phosphonate transport system transcriptional regulator